MAISIRPRKRYKQARNQIYLIYEYLDAWYTHN
jgi:hypothetical protein